MFTRRAPRGGMLPAAMSVLDLDRRLAELEVDWRIADRAGVPEAPVRTLKRFGGEAGRPGLADV